MISPENFIGELQTEVDLPIKYILHTSGGYEFKISIFYERWLRGDKSQRDVNSDIPIATWLPERGISSVNFTYYLLRDAGLEPTLEKFCEQAYSTWKGADG
jgi:hypothetical protein